jgi:hypothetical protein
VSHGTERERELLTAAVGQIQAGLCLSCPTRRAKVRWSVEGGCWQLVVVHRPKCSATRSRLHRRRADEFLHGLLQLHGLLIGDYNEDFLLVHAKVMVLP